MNDFITEIEPINNLIKGFTTIQMFRAKFGFKRGYILPEPFTVYSGLTGALSAATFKGDIGSKKLDKWRDKMISHLGGQETQESYLNSLADFGTLCHQTIVTIKETGKLVWSEQQDEAAAFFVRSAQQNSIQVNGEVVKSQVAEFCKVAASILQFVHENVVEIHSVEGMCKSDELMIATPVDFVITIKTKKGDIRVCINLKTSEQFGSHHWEQVALERYMWNLTYPDFKVEKTGLLRGKDWRMKKGIPTYEFELLEEEQETSILKNSIQRLMLCKSHEDSTYLNYQSGLNMFTGETKLGETPKLAFRTIEELWIESIKKEDEKK